MDLNLEGNAAIITASSSGLGKASAVGLAEEGVNVVINGRSEKQLISAAKEIKSSTSSRVATLTGDIKEKGTLEKLVNKAIDEYGQLDHVVTSAGGPPSGKTMETSEDDWYDSFELLVMSVFRLVKEAEPYLKKGGGTIVNITSRTVKEALDSLVLSNSVRMSVIGLEKTLSRELAPDVRVNSVLPGPHKTSRIEDLVNQALERGEVESREEGLEKWSEGVPMEKLGNPENLGRLVAFLSSEKAGFINGAAIPIDGGASRSNL
jgi:3-oxoacyl-[acyl-carrier protein] reductase